MATGRTRKLRWLVGAAACLALALAGVWPQASLAASWSAPVHIAGSGLNGVSCPSTSFCVAVGEGGQAFAYNGSSWSSGTAIDGTDDLRASCPSTSFCAAVGEGGHVLTFNGTAWSAPTLLSQPVVLRGVSCPTTSFCMAVSNVYNNNGGASSIYNGSAWSAPISVHGTFGYFEGVSCTSPAFCIATAHIAEVATYRGGAWEEEPTHLEGMDVERSPAALTG